MGRTETTCEPSETRPPMARASALVNSFVPPSKTASPRSWRGTGWSVHGVLRWSPHSQRAPYSEISTDDPEFMIWHQRSKKRPARVSHRGTCTIPRTQAVPRPRGSTQPSGLSNQEVLGMGDFLQYTVI